jgi:hypothetical protein
MLEKPPAGNPVICDEGIELALVNTVPVVAGKVSVVDPAVAGAESVTVPEVSPAMTTDAMIYSLLN